MSMVIDFAHPDDVDRPPRWNRFERADRYVHYLKLQAQGISQRQAAKQRQGLILDSRVVIGQVWRNRLFIQAFPGGATDAASLEKAVI